MPNGNIETYTNNVRAPVADNRGAEAYEQLGRHAEAAYAQAGNAIKGAINTVGDAIDNHISLTETSDLTNKFATLEMQSAQDLEKTKTSMDPHDTSAASNFLQAHEDALNSIGEGLISSRGRAMFNQMSANYRVNMFNKVIGYQSAAAADSVISNFDQAGDKYANMANTDPNSVATSIANIQSASAGIPAEHRDSVTRNLVTRVADSGGEGIVNSLLRNPSAKPADADAAMAFLKDPKNPFLNSMSPAQYNSVMDRLSKIKDTQGNAQSVIAAQTLADGYKQVEGNGGVDNNDALQTIINNYQGTNARETAEFKAKNQRDLDAAVVTGRATRAVASTPTDDLTGDIFALKAKLDGAAPEDVQKYESEYKAVIEAKRQRDEAFKKDPADWVNTNNEVVKARYGAFAANPTPQNFQAYAAASTAEQRRLYPLQTPRIVSAEMSDTIGTAVGKITNSPEGAAAAADILSSYARTAGAYWSGMAQELYHNKVLNPNQFVAASLYGKPDGSALAEEILRSSIVPEKDLAEKNVGNPGVTPQKARAAANAQFANLARTMQDDRNPNSVVGGYEQALTTVLLNRGDTSEDTAHRLAQKMINDEYTFPKNATYRIPNSAHVNPDDVDAGLEKVQGNVQTARSGVETMNLIVPRSYSYLGPKDQTKAYVANVQRLGHWVTNSTETGVVLYDESQQPVWQRGPDGKPQMVGIDWKTAAAHGSAIRGIEGKFYKLLVGQKFSMGQK